MLFAGGTKGIALDRERLALKVVAGDDPDVLIHDPTNRGIAAMLILMPHEGFPIALGVIYEDPAPTFESVVVEQNKAAASGKTPDLQALVAKGQTWQVEKEPHQFDHADGVRAVEGFGQPHPQSGRRADRPRWG